MPSGVLHGADRGSQRRAMSCMGFAIHPGKLPFWTIRDAAKWEPRLTNGQIEIRGEGCEMPQQMVRVIGIMPIEDWQARCAGLYVPPIYKGKKLIAVKLDAL